MSLFLDYIGYSVYLAKMGFCMSKESTEDVEQKKRSQMIDRKLEEDAKRRNKGGLIAELSAENDR